MDCMVDSRSWKFPYGRGDLSLLPRAESVKSLFKFCKNKNANHNNFFVIALFHLSVDGPSMKVLRCAWKPERRRSCLKLSISIGGDRVPPPSWHLIHLPGFWIMHFLTIWTCTWTCRSYLKCSNWFLTRIIIQERICRRWKELIEIVHVCRFFGF